MIREKYLIRGLVCLLIAGLMVGCQNKEEKAKPVYNVIDVIGQEITLSDGFVFCMGSSGVEKLDEFSEAYAAASTMVVDAVDKETGMATVTVVAPPIAQIMCQVPPAQAQTFEEDFAQYMESVIQALRECPQEDKVTTVVQCPVVDDNGWKLLPNDALADAVYPDLQTLIADLLFQALAS